MKKKSHTPRYLVNVLQAIYELKDLQGSTTRKILDHVQAGTKRTSSRNIYPEVQRALNHAVTAGIVKARAGKYRINTRQFDPRKNCAECRRGGRRRKRSKRRRRRGRRHSQTPIIEAFLDGESRSEIQPRRRGRTYHAKRVPVQEMRRRRKRSSSRRRRRRGRRLGRRVADVDSNDKDEDDVEENKRTDDSKDIVYPDDYDVGEGDDVHEDGQCDNPDCLCQDRQDVDRVDDPDYDRNDD